VNPPLRVTPAPALADVTAYAVPRAGAPIDLHLDGNEGAWPSLGLVQAVDDVSRLRRYPSARALESRLAARLGVATEQVIVTAGGDESIDRVCRAMLRPDRDEVLLPEPTFEMIHRYARLSGGRIVGAPWGETWPRNRVLAALSDRTALVFVVTPNNPTGQVATREDVRAVAAAAPHALVVLDHAYVEFADDDYTDLVHTHPNILVIRTLAKAWGLAGLRVGYAVGDARVIAWLRAAGGPYPVAGPSLAIAEAALAAGDLGEFVATVRSERETLTTLLAEIGGRAVPSHANFVFARVRDPLWVRDGMAGLGVGVRAFPGKARLEDAIRITCPGRADHFARLTAGLRAVLAPELVFLDGVDGERIGPLTGIRCSDVPAALADNGARPAWLVTPSADGVRAARAAGVVPIALAAPGSPDAASLIAAGAARAVATLADLEPLLP